MIKDNLYWYEDKEGNIQIVCKITGTKEEIKRKIEIIKDLKNKSLLDIQNK